MSIRPFGRYTVGRVWRGLFAESISSSPHSVVKKGPGPSIAHFCGFYFTICTLLRDVDSGALQNSVSARRAVTSERSGVVGLK